MRYQKAWHHTRRYWVFYLPLFLFTAETATQTLHEFMLVHYSVAFREQTWLAIAEALRSTFRVGLCYVLITLLFEVSLSLLPARIKTFFYFEANRIWIFLLLYCLLSREVGIQKPALSSMYYFYINKPLFFLATAGFIVGLIRYFIRDLDQPIGISHARWDYGLVMAALVVGLISTRTSPWSHQETQSTTAVKDTKKPSFLLIGMDGIPGDVFRENRRGKYVAPLWNAHWKKRSIRYQNAYSPSNSTFTTWFSILSGRYPVHSQVETLYPHKREGAVPAENLLPNQLKQQGYKTIYMTDCAATATMKHSYGWEEMYQVDKGVFQCGRGLFTGSHPLTYVNGFFDHTNWLMPELDSFCSPVYRPANFFSAVMTRLKQLEKEKRPFLLAMHSCLPHHQVLPHVPSMRSQLRKNLPPQKGNFSQQKHNLMATVRAMDFHVNELLMESHDYSKPLWRYVFSDHGSRIDTIDNRLRHFTHAVGHPVNRHQYNVPFAILPPEPKKRRLGQNRMSLMSLVDLYPTVLSHAGIEPPANDGKRLPGGSGRSVLLTSALPMKFRKDKSALIDVFQQNTLNEEGIHAFPKKVESDLLRNRPVALVHLPYRLILQRGKKPRLYQELRDPENKNDIAKHNKRLVQDLTEELCRIYPASPCPPKLRRNKSKLLASRSTAPIWLEAHSEGLRSEAE